MSKTKSEDVLGEKWDRCLADTSLKIAGGKMKLAIFNKNIIIFMVIHRTGSWKCILITFVQEENVANNFWNWIWVRNGLLKL